ncbi:MAG: hypothetical protein RIS26_257, partial [Actinomycetota bacterium]
ASILSTLETMSNEESAMSVILVAHNQVFLESTFVQRITGGRRCIRLVTQAAKGI